MDPGGARGTRHVVCFKSEIPEIFVRPLLAPLVALPGEQGVQLCCKVLELVMHKPPQCPDNESLSHTRGKVFKQFGGPYLCNLM